MNEPETGLPEVHEYDAYYASYVELAGVGPIVETLQRQRGETLALLADLTEEQAVHRYAPGKWSIKEVIGHLLHTERVFVYRALCFARGEPQAQPGFDQDDYVSAGEFDARSVSSLASEYEAVRGATVALFRGLGSRAWRATGSANRVAFSVRALAYIIAGHEAHHLSIVRRRYLDERP
jgi:hypothetical protein